ncbi:glycosyltransferase family 9 protein [Candidatus Nitrospira bockiana]
MTGSDVKKIAILRANGLGDLIFSLPAVESLRVAFPAAEIIWLGAPLHAALFSGRPSPVDRVVVVPPFRGVRDEPETDRRAVRAFFAAMADEQIDVALQLHGGGRHSNPFIRRLRARLTVGMKTPDAVPLDRWIPYVYFQPEVLRYLEVVSLLGVRPVRLEPRVAVTETDDREADRVLPRRTPLAVLHPGATDGRRRWPAEKFARVGDVLAAAGAAVAIIGLEQEKPVIEQVLASMTSPALDLGGRLTLHGLIGALARCRVFVGNDSGPLHLAAALGAATVGIFWCGNLINGGPLTRRRHRPAVSWCLCCPVCGTNCMEGRCPHRESFVADVPTDEVAEAARKLFEQTAREASPERDPTSASIDGLTFSAA